ncbi:MAG: chorismate synthase [Gammaproteobacteria bacterium]|nr:MAG: chorismate synthase [Gammaproteobacteria bacterium]
MSGDSIGKLFRVTNWGESHGPMIGAVVEGCPSGMALSVEDIQPALDRRKPGQSKIVTQRKEADEVQIVSGLVDGITTGTPISLLMVNQDQKSKDYSNIADLYRPSHGDFTYQQKYGIRDVAGGGRTSARVTAPSVAAGAIAEKLLMLRHQIKITAWVESVQDISCEADPEQVNREQVESNIIRCPDPDIAEKMIERIETVRKEGNTVGGVIACCIQSVPIGLGEPVYDKLEADLAHAMMSINASKGFEFGSGFAGTLMRGTEHNDAFINEDNQIKTSSNYSGGIQAGISNGMPINFRVAFKPVATLLKKQQTVNKAGETVDYQVHGRHDPCVLPRAVPIVEAMAALVLCDHSLRQFGSHPISAS